MFTRFGLDVASQRGSAEMTRGGESDVGKMLLIACALAAALSIAGMGVPHFFYRVAFAGINLLVLVVLPALAIVPILAGALRGLGKVRLAAVGGSVLHPALALLMAIIALRTHSAGWASASMLVSTGALVRLGSALVAVAGLNALGNALDIMILGRAGAIAQIALYAVALKVARSLLLVADANTLAIGPSIPRLMREGDVEHLGLMYRTSVRWVALMTAPGILILIIAPELILALFGAQFSAAAPILRIHAVTFAIFAFAGPAKIYLLMSGHEHFLTRNAALNVVMTAVLMIALIPRYGGIGAAAALLAATVTQRVLLLAKVRSSIGIRVLDGRNLMLFIGFASAVAASLTTLQAGRVAVALMAVALFLAGAAAGGFDDADRNFVSGIVSALTPQRRRTA